ncbi:nucleotidyltransferase family protein [Alkaliphilus peptidifermentans]|uniref:MobA-like NTP transferase domain-containing protein n=1 Tax=Alkaliphilus peptidifermentans DSM 18978 TaxID=1120976 RepID=A0A1G5KHH7_9FIRM|nr:nucleotidyltransferase family protein [Alkaliphilus peptidifermentans]SCZ00115.1 MobA-like NTP transferase domain-containing protein [Alkaliphilus peptidifermentans DSM 18978]
MHAIVLAGNDAVAEELMKNKAIIPLKGIPMIKFVVNALKESKYIDKIYVVGEVDELESIIGAEAEAIIRSSNTFMENLINGMAYSQGEDRVIVATCDVPLINVDIINKFIEVGLEVDNDIFYPIVNKALNQTSYPNLKRTYAHLKEGAFTGGNIVMLKPSIMGSIKEVTETLVRHRKNPIRMCRVLGVPFVIKLIFKQLKITDIEKMIKNRFKITGRAYICNFPEICNDLDHYQDKALFEEYL